MSLTLRLPSIAIDQCLCGVSLYTITGVMSDICYLNDKVHTIIKNLLVCVFVIIKWHCIYDLLDILRNCNQDS